MMMFLLLLESRLVGAVGWDPSDSLILGKSMVFVFGRQNP